MNHCPGADVLLFRVWHTGRWVLHTGDCQYDVAYFARHRSLVRHMEGDMVSHMSHRIASHGVIASP